MNAQETDEEYYLQIYRDLLDEIYPAVELGHGTFLASKIIEELDPIMFRCGFVDEEYPTHYCNICKEEYHSLKEAEDCCVEDDDEET